MSATNSWHAVIYLIFSSLVDFATEFCEERDYSSVTIYYTSSTDILRLAFNLARMLCTVFGGMRASSSLKVTCRGTVKGGCVIVLVQLFSNVRCDWNG